MSTYSRRDLLRAIAAPLLRLRSGQVLSFPQPQPGYPDYPPTVLTPEQRLDDHEGWLWALSIKVLQHEAVLKARTFIPNAEGKT